MNRSELTLKVHQKMPELDAAAARSGVDCIIETMTKSLADQGRIEVRGFGSFSVRTHEARTGRNPKTGDSVAVDSGKKPFFKPGKPLKERINATA